MAESNDNDGQMFHNCLVFLIVMVIQLFLKSTEALID